MKELVRFFRRETVKKAPVFLVSGNNPWDVMVNSKKRLTWMLAYPNYASLPVHNGFDGLVNYDDKNYKFVAIFSNLIFVSGPVR